MLSKELPTSGYHPDAVHTGLGAAQGPVRPFRYFEKRLWEARLTKDEFEARLNALGYSLHDPAVFQAVLALIRKRADAARAPGSADWSMPSTTD